MSWLFGAVVSTPVCLSVCMFRAKETVSWRCFIACCIFRAPAAVMAEGEGSGKGLYLYL